MGEGKIIGQCPPPPPPPHPAERLLTIRSSILYPGTTTLLPERCRGNAPRCGGLVFEEFALHSSHSDDSFLAVLGLTPCSGSCNLVHKVTASLCPDGGVAGTYLSEWHCDLPIWCQCHSGLTYAIPCSTTQVWPDHSSVMGEEQPGQT